MSPLTRLVYLPYSAIQVRQSVHAPAASNCPLSKRFRLLFLFHIPHDLGREYTFHPLLSSSYRQEWSASVRRSCEDERAKHSILHCRATICSYLDEPTEGQITSTPYLRLDSCAPVAPHPNSSDSHWWPTGRTLAPITLNRTANLPSWAG